MDKSLNNKLSGGKPLSNSEFTHTSQQATTTDLTGLLSLVQPSADNTISTVDGDKSFGVITTDDIIINNNLSIGSDELLQIIPAQELTINGVATNSTIVTTKEMMTTGDIGYTSIKFIVPYVFDEPDHVPDASKNEAPDNYLEIENSKFRVTGPFTIIKSVRAVFTEPIITISYIDKVDANTSDSTVLALNTYDRGISYEYTTENNGAIKLGFFGYSWEKGRFVFYQSAAYNGQTDYEYVGKDGIKFPGGGKLTDYNVISTDTITPTKVDIDSLYTNTISSAYYTTMPAPFQNFKNRKLNINAHDDMTISVGIDTTENPSPPARNYNYTLTSKGKINMTAGDSSTISTLTCTSTGQMSFQSSSSLTCTSTGQMSFQSSSVNGIIIGTVNSGYPVNIGSSSTIKINNYLQATNYLSVGATTRNSNTIAEIGGSFTATSGICSGLLLDEIITGVGTYPIYSTYSTPTINTPAGQAVPNVANMSLLSSSLNISSGGSVARSSTLYIDGATSNATENYAIYVNSGNIKFMGTNNSYMSWENNSFSIFQGGVLVNQTVITGTTAPVLSVTTRNNSTSMYTMFKQAVTSTSESELFVDGSSTRIAISNNHIYNISGTIAATQSDGTSASFRIEATIAYVGGTKSVKQLTITVLHNDSDLFSFDVSTTSSGDNLYFAGQSNSATSTNWYGNIFVDVISTS